MTTIISECRKNVATAWLNHKMKSTYLIILLTFWQLTFAQSANFHLISKQIENGEPGMALKTLDSLKKESFSGNQLANFLHLRARAYSKLNNADLAYRDFLSARQKFREIDSIDKAMDITLQIVKLISLQEQNKNDYQKYLDEYLAYAKTSRDPRKILIGHVEQASVLIDYEEADKKEKPKAEKSLHHFWKAIWLNKTIKDDKLEAKINNNIAVLYSEVLQNYDSSLYYLDRDYEKLLRIGDQTGMIYNLINQAATYYALGNHQKAITLLHQAERSDSKEFEQKIKAIIYYNLYDNYEQIADHKNALKYLRLSNDVENQINESDQNIAISDMQTKYRAKEKELENLSLKNKLNTNKMFMMIFVGLLFVSLLIGVLGYKNIARKRRIAEQDRLIEKQKLEKTLKEQELHQIDLMLESQEKERQQIANEIHDNLGSILVTLKLNYQSLKRDNNNPESRQIFEKNDELIDEAYQKVRDISHLKNLGVIGTHGLIAAVNTMAEKMSVINKLKFNVFPFGFQNRLENSLEVTLFRIIQELSANIIKHAKATEASIYLTQHYSEGINIIIEDNGRGFDPEVLDDKPGIGLKNLQKKIEQLGGDFTIDSVPGNGTTIIINIPIHDNSSNSRGSSSADRRHPALP